MKTLNEKLEEIQNINPEEYNEVQEKSMELSIEQLKTFDEAYFEGSPLIPDEQYDRIKSDLAKKYPNHPYFSSVGSEVYGEKVELPYPMGSLHQIYEGDCTKWINKYNLYDKDIFITEKLDGVSVMMIYEKIEGEEKAMFKKAYSRGNGLIGEDITRHVRNIPSVPNSIDADYAAIRAEIIMKNVVFEDKHSRKYKNPRNMVAGVVNRKKPEVNLLKDIDVIAYEIVDSSGIDAFTKKETLEALETLGFKTAYGFTIEGNELYGAGADEKLSKFLLKLKNLSLYELDGCVLTANDYSLFENVSKSSSLNPEHSVKYKVLDESSIAETDVVNVHWKISKTGFCKPRVEIKPVELFGSTVTFATGFNAKFINDSGIGVGAKIKITKAGSVIPYIVEVTERVEPQMPDLDWGWDENRVEAVVENTIEQTFMEVVHFFKTIGVENAQETSLGKVIQAQDLNGLDFTTIVYELICLFDLEWKRVLGENGIKVFDSLHKKLFNMKPEVLMGATPFFGRGFGVRKAKKILQQISYEDFLDADIETLQKLEGFDTTVQAIFEGIEEYNEFLSKIDFALVYKEEEQTDNNLAGEIIVMTGFRDKDLQEKIENRGGKVTTSVSKKTTKVIANDVNSSSSKVKKAKELGIEVISQRDFNFQYIQ